MLVRHHHRQDIQQLIMITTTADIEKIKYFIGVTLIWLSSYL